MIAESIIGAVQDLRTAIGEQPSGIRVSLKLWQDLKRELEPMLAAPSKSLSRTFYGLPVTIDHGMSGRSFRLVIDEPPKDLRAVARNLDTNPPADGRRLKVEIPRGLARVGESAGPDDDGWVNVDER